MKLKRRTFLKILGIGLACPSIAITRRLTFKEQVHKVSKDLATGRVSDIKGLKALYRLKATNDTAFKEAMKSSPHFCEAVTKVDYVILSEPEKNDFWKCDTIKRRNDVRHYHAWRERVRKENRV